jgi:hypothetical protein
MRKQSASYSLRHNFTTHADLYTVLLIAYSIERIEE